MSDYREVRKNAFDNGILLDYCGSDERYYYNGLYIDLCGMSADEYMNATKFPCCGESGDGDDPITPQPTATTKESLTLLFTYRENEDGTYSSIVKATPTPKQNVEIEYIIQDKDGDITVNGEITPSVNPFVYSSKKFDAMYNIVGERQNSIDPSNNEYYNEVILKIGDEISYFGLINSTALTDFNNYDFSKLESKTINDELTSVEMTVQPYVDGNLSTDELYELSNNDEWYNEFIKNNSYILALAFNESDWDKNMISIYGPDGKIEITDTFAKIISNVIINGKEYCIVAKKFEEGSGINQTDYNSVKLLALINDDFNEGIKQELKLKIR